MLGSKKRKEKRLVNEIESLYWELNKSAYSIYNFTKCTKCGSSILNIRVISSSGQTVEYSCEKCDEIMACTLKKGKNPKKAMKIQDSIRNTTQELYNLIGEDVHLWDIDVAFDIS